jgi:formate dehydrogenase iron-sulfur subunit
MSARNRRSISRRSFLKGVGTGGAALTTACFLNSKVSPVSASGNSTEQCCGVLVDLTRCTGCGSCCAACKASNYLPPAAAVPAALDCSAYTCLQVHQVGVASDSPETLYVKRQCMHCIHPGCVSACTVGALRKTSEGPVVYDADKCIGCRYCQYACPFEVPTYDWEDPFGLIHKCQFCSSRLIEDRAPACVAACPNGALRFGSREALLAQARAQIVSNPGRYVDDVYGEHEVGGTSMLYLSPVPFDQIGFPVLGDQPIPHYAETIMKGTPFIAVAVASAITGVHWFLKRREQRPSLARARNNDAGAET